MPEFLHQRFESEKPTVVNYYRELYRKVTTGSYFLPAVFGIPGAAVIVTGLIQGDNNKFIVGAILITGAALSYAQYRRTSELSKENSDDDSIDNQV